MASQEERDKEAVSDFPILCEKCLGTNPFVRMSKERHGRACKICERPYSFYRWRPGKEARFNQTEICQMCAKLKNACQTCTLDLQFGLPTQIRDAVLDESDVMNVPENDVNREYLFRQLERQTEIGDKDASGMLALPYGKSSPAGMVDRLAKRHKPYIRLQNICKLFLEGKCQKGRRCPYRHEAPLTAESSEQDLNERYQSRNVGAGDQFRAPPDPPADKTVTTIFVGGVDEQVSEQDILREFGKFGSVSTVRVLAHVSCAFVEMVERAAAEKAMKALWGKLTVHQTRLRINWAKPRGSGTRFSDAQVPLVGPESGKSDTEVNKFLSIAAPPKKAAAIPPPPGMGKKRRTYPSQDPKNSAAKLRSN